MHAITPHGELRLERSMRRGVLASTKDNNVQFAADVGRVPSD